VIVVVAIALGLQLIRVQIVDGSRYANYGTNETETQVALPATRGAIYDRDGDLLSASVTRYDVVGDDMLVTDPVATAKSLAPYIHVPVAALTIALSNKKDGYVVLAREITANTESTIASLVLPGITFATDMLRVSPGGALFQPVLGQVNTSSEGFSALEYEYNALLNGKSGSELVAVDPAGSELPSGAKKVVPAVQGESLVLTIDEPLQNEVTKEVTAQVIATHSNSGIAVIEDVHSGDILAMVDLVRGPKGVISPAPSNLAVTSIYQPGSVMKLATISYALQDHLITPDSTFTVPYSLNVGGYTFQDAEVHATEVLPVKQILAQSSNIGTIKISQLLGLTRLAQAFHALGFGQPSGLNFPDESQGIIGSPAQWIGSSAASVPIGTGVAVTPMQVLDAYNSVANGGVFVTPKLVADTIDASGNEHATPPSSTRQALLPSTVKQLVPMLAGVVCDETGTALLARIPGYTVAGKTGTAQVPSTTGPGYVLGDWNASFVGFVPAQAPKLSGIVVLNHPTPIYGGTVSAPVFAEVMQYALRHFDIPPPTQVSASTANAQTSTSSLDCNPGA
jgi:cell division protein FtsI (penicillin-binding protein 3)